MSGRGHRSWPSEAQRRMMRFACVRCGAPVGEVCRTPSGPYWNLHAVRFYAAREAGLLPVEQTIVEEVMP